MTTREKTVVARNMEYIPVDYRVLDEKTEPVTDEMLAGLEAALRERISSPDFALDAAINIDLGSDLMLHVDCGQKTVTRSDAPADSQLGIQLGNLERVISGELDPRYAMLFGLMKVGGSPGIATKFCDFLAHKDYIYPSDDDSGRTLPVPTADLDLAKSCLDEFGYCVITGALDEGTLASLRSRLMDQAQGERDIGRAQLDGQRDPLHEGPNQRVWSLLNKGGVFMDLLEHPLIEEFMPSFVGDYFLLSGYFANIAGPGGPEQFLHTDQVGMQPPLPDVAAGLNLSFFLDDFTEANGATRVVPRSHRADPVIAPADVFSMTGAVPVTGPAGSAFLFDSRLWHGAGSNRTDRKRHGIFLYFIRSWIRTGENWMWSAHPSVMETASDRVKTMLGFRQTGPIGRVGASSVGEIVRWDPDDLILELSPKSAT